MSDAVWQRLQALLGPEGVERDPRGLPRAIPDSDDALAMLCQAAADEGWHCRVEGHGSWLAGDAPADFTLGTRGLSRIHQIAPADLVATVEAGVSLDVLRAELAKVGMWLAVDPPGRPDRTIGSIVATATAGPLRHGFGPLRDQILGCTVATGDGRLVESGGRVVKNVAGYDLAKLHTGGFGAFGVITSLHLRLRAQPGVDLTFVTHGQRAELMPAAQSLLDAQLGLAACELLAPAVAASADWTLAVRLLGTDAGARAEAERLRGVAGVHWDTLTADRAATLWNLVARAALAGPVTLRGGALRDGLDESLDLLIERLGEGLLTAGPGTGALRWSGDATATELRQLRVLAAAREIPVTVERAPWELRRAIGHFGAYREGVGRLVGRLRETFDPKGCIAVALEEERRE